MEVDDEMADEVRREADLLCRVLLRWRADHREYSRDNPGRCWTIFGLEILPDDMPSSSELNTASPLLDFSCAAFVYLLDDGRLELTKLGGRVFLDPYPEPPNALNDLLDKEMFSCTVSRVLIRKMALRTWGDLAGKTADDLLAQKDIGPSRLREILRALWAKGLDLRKVGNPTLRSPSVGQPKTREKEIIVLPGDSGWGAFVSGFPEHIQAKLRGLTEVEAENDVDE